MKNHFRFFSWLYTAVIALLGFAGCSDDPSSMADMYGVPTADYKYMGKVTDENGNPIKGINVVFQKHSYGDVAPEVFRIETDKNGRYSTDYIHWDTGGISQILYTDVDGEENGGHFEDKVAQTGYMKKEKTGAGDGWYAGKYILSDEIRLYHKPAEDNTEEEDDEQPENEGNNE